MAGYRADTLPFAINYIDGSHMKWAWLRSLAVHDRSFVLKHGKRLGLVLWLFSSSNLKPTT
jgi:hypothetical protein